jgi:hypothetical protein
VECEMQTKVSFKLSGEHHEYMCIDGVQLDVKELLITSSSILDWKKRRGQVSVKSPTRSLARS